MWYTRLSLVVCMLAASSLSVADVEWPANDDYWHPLLVSGSFYTDPDDVTPASTDIRGGLDSNSNEYVAGYWYYNGDHLMFRMRIDQAPPATCTQVWQIMLDTDSDTGVDWVLQTDYQSDNRVELVPATVEGPTLADVELDTTASWHGDLTIYHTCADPTGDASKFDSDLDAFNDLAIPWSNFSSITGVTSSSPFRIGLSTATQENLINKDLPRNLTGSSSVDDAFSDPGPAGIGCQAAPPQAELTAPDKQRTNQWPRHIAWAILFLPRGRGRDCRGCRKSSLFASSVSLRI